MSNPVLPAIAVVQMGHVEKVVQAEQDHAEAQQGINQQQGAITLRQQGTSVQSVDPSQTSKKIQTEDGGGGKQAPQEQRNKKKQAQADPDTASGASGASKDDPWTGNLLNIEV